MAAAPAPPSRVDSSSPDATPGLRCLAANAGAIFPTKFDYGRGFYEGLAAVLVGKVLGYIDMTGKSAIPFAFREA